MKRLKHILLIILTIGYLSPGLVFTVFAQESTVVEEVVNVQPEQIVTNTNEEVSEVETVNIENTEEFEPDIVVVDDLSGIDTDIDTEGLDPQDSSDVPEIQETINTQDDIEKDVLEVEDTEDVEVILVEKEPIDDIEIITPEKEEEVIEEEVVDIVEEIVDTEEPLIDNKISIREIKPKSVFKFSLTYRIIDTKKISKNTTENNFSKSKSLDNTLNPSLEEESEGVSFSGVCNSKYFTVLLYKNAQDYTDNPASSILNKAFNCVNNSFSYTIEQLPSNLDDGTYYLLIGQQGDTGSWVPISSLTEIVINRQVPTFVEENISVPEEEPIIATEPTLETPVVIPTEDNI